MARTANDVSLGIDCIVSEVCLLVMVGVIESAILVMAAVAEAEKVGKCRW